MRADLPVDKLEAPLRIGNLFAEAGRKLGQKIAVFERRGLRIEMQLGNLTGEQSLPFRIERRNIPLGVPYLPRDA